VHHPQRTELCARDESFREHVSEQSLNAFKHRHEAATAQSPEVLAASAQRYLEGQGYKVKSLPREDGVLLPPRPAAGTASAISWRIRPSC